MAARSPAHQALGRTIRAARSKRGLSQEGLAQESGLDRTYVGGIERGERNPSFEALRTLAEVIDTPLSKLFAAAEREPQWRRWRPRKQG